MDAYIKQTMDLVSDPEKLAALQRDREKYIEDIKENWPAVSLWDEDYPVLTSLKFQEFR